MDLTTNYLGLPLKHPIVAGASPLSRELDSVRALEDAGVSAIVLYSLFAEQIEHDSGAHDHFDAAATDSFAEASSFAPSLDYCPRGPQEYADHLSEVKKAVDIPVIASLNGAMRGTWTEYAKILQQAGADALELNIYEVATDPSVDAKGVEDRYVEILGAVKAVVSLPVALKIGPYFTSLASFAKRLDQSGVDGLVLFNRFYQPDIDLETLEVVPDLTLSAAHEMRLPLRWVAILDPFIEASLAATTAIYTPFDVLKLVLAGADVTMLCAALLKGGPSVATKLLAGVHEWMEEHEYESIRQMKGSMNHRTCPDPAAFERANYMKALYSYT